MKNGAPGIVVNETYTQIRFNQEGQVDGLQRRRLNFFALIRHPCLSMPIAQHC